MSLRHVAEVTAEMAIHENSSQRRYISELNVELYEARALAWETAERLFRERLLWTAAVDRHDAITEAYARVCPEPYVIRLDACRLFQEQQEYRRIPRDCPTTSPEHVACAYCGHPLAHHAVDEDRRPRETRMACEDGECCCREFVWGFGASS